MKSRLSPSLKLAVYFLVFGLAWIFFTDFLFLGISRHSLSLYYKFQNYKGVLFVVISALLIFFLGRTLYSHIDKANKEQQEALRRFNVLGMATNDAVWDLNLITGECYTNRALQSMFGYTVAELSDNNIWWRTNIHPDDRERVMDLMASTLKGGGLLWQDEYRFRCKGGGYKTIFDRSVIMRDKNGDPYRLIGAMQDVSEQRALQQQLINEKVRHKNEVVQEIINAQEEERKKLGEELHDNVNQLLGVVKLYVEHIQINPPMKEELLAKCSEYLNQVIEEIRMLSKSLSPPGLNLLSLIDSVEDLIRTIRDAKNIYIELDSSEFIEEDVPLNKQLTIYRIVQEQLNNVLKHSNADRVRIELKSMQKVVSLKIIDNGIGFDIKATKPGIGLNNIRNRLYVFNGNMEINSAPGEGCKLSVEFSL